MMNCTRHRRQLSFLWNPISILILLCLIFLIISINVSLNDVKNAYNTNTNIEEISLLVGGVTSDSASFRIRIPKDMMDNNNNNKSDDNESSRRRRQRNRRRRVKVESESEDKNSSNNNPIHQFIISTSSSISNNKNNNGIVYQEPIDKSNMSISNVYAIQVNQILEPNTRYYYGIAAVASPTTTTTTTNTTTTTTNAYIKFGTFHTPKIIGTPYNFTIALSGCAWTGSKAQIFNTISQEGSSSSSSSTSTLSSSPFPSPLQFFMHLGDFHYEDIGINDMNQRLQAINRVLNSPTQSKLYSSTSLVYIWDDHDWLGNDSGFHEGNEIGARNTALQSYDISFPHYPFAAATTDDATTSSSSIPPYHAFTIGTIRFIISDLRSEAKHISKNSTSYIYSIAQKEWLYNELSNASNYDFVIWATSKPWIAGDVDDVVDYDPEEDGWKGFRNDRKDLSNHITNVVYNNNKGPQNLLAVSSDAHMIAYDDGSHTFYGGTTTITSSSSSTDDNNNKSNDASTTTQPPSFPILQTGPLDRKGSVKGGPYTEGCYTTKYERNHQYSTIEFRIPSSKDDNINSSTGIKSQQPCMIITTYRVNKAGEKSIIFTKELCGKIFASPKPDNKTNNKRCKAKTISDISTALFVVSVVFTLLSIIILICAMKSHRGGSDNGIGRNDESSSSFLFYCRGSIMMSFIIIFFFLFNIIIYVAIPVLFLNITQLETQTNMIISILQSGTILIFTIIIWFVQQNRRQ